MKKLLILFISIILLSSCSSAPTKSEQYNKIQANVLQKEYGSEPFYELAVELTDAAVHNKGFKRQSSVLENPYVRAKTDFDRFIYGEFFVFKNIESARLFMLQTEISITATMVKYFPDLPLSRLKDSFAVGHEFAIITHLQELPGVFGKEYYVSVNITFFDSPFKVERIY